jgi:hypothetical protein
MIWRAYLSVKKVLLFRAVFVDPLATIDKKQQ